LWKYVHSKIRSYLTACASLPAADGTIKGGWPGARVGQIEGALPYHLQDANGTDKNVVSYIPNGADNISYHAANFGVNAVITTADMGS
jgi:hypothetical protein